MLLNTIILAFSASIDSLGVGITYGLKNTKISFSSIFILFFLSIAISSISVFLGNVLSFFISPNLTTLLGAIILFGIGGFIIYGAVFKKDKKKIGEENNTKKVNIKRKEYNIFIHFLGITINIIKDPINSDFDNSNKIDIKEALFLGFALSLDSISIGFGGATMGITSFTFPLLISFFQILFLCIGRFLGKKINNVSKLPNNIWNIISGTLLIFMGIIKLL